MIPNCHSETPGAARNTALVPPETGSFATLRMTALILLSVCALSACAGKPLPDYHYYRLNIAAPESRPATGKMPGLVLVEAPRSPAVYAPRAIAYSSGPVSPALEHYHYHAWIDPPARLLQQELVRYLQAMQFGSAVVSEASRVTPDYNISGEIRRFERFKSDPGWSVAVEVEFRLDAASSPGPLFVHSYRQTVAASDETMEGSVEAFSAGVAGVFRAFSADLMKAHEQSRSTGAE